MTLHDRDTSVMQAPAGPTLQKQGPVTATPDKFRCRRCGACCRIPDGIVRVSDDEIARIAKFLGLTEEAFIANETELAPDRRGLILKNTSAGACVYLTPDNLCRINPVKPDKCRTFPFAWTNADSDSVCPELNRLASGKPRPPA